MNYKLPGYTTVLLSAAVGAAVAQAQDNKNGANYDLLLEEVQVTAQRREQSLQDVPISISAFNGDKLDDLGINNLDDLVAISPGLSTGGGRGNSSFFLRGVGTRTSDPGDTASVATYIDGVYMVSPLNGSFAFPNIDRIEVIKGPQGTLFGQSATGGLIHVITKEPSFDPAGSVLVRYGNYDTLDFRGYISGGLTDSLAGDLSAYVYDQAEGFGTNTVNGNDVNHRREWQLRGKLLWEASDDTSFTLTATYGESENDFGIRKIAPGTVGILGTVAEPGRYDIQHGNEDDQDRENYGTSLRIKHSFGDVELVSTTAYNFTSVERLFDQDGTPIPFVDAFLREESESWQQELLLNGSSERLNWTAGATYFYDESGAYPVTIVPPPLQGSGQRIERTSYQDLESLAVFGQLTYSLLDELRLTLGFRNTWDERELNFLDQIVLADGVDPRVSPANSVAATLREGSADESWSEPTYRIALDYDLNDDTLLYGSFSRGYKTGAFTAINIAPAGEAPSIVDPEILDALELGFKWTSSSNRLRINGSAFYYEYDDMHLLRVFTGGAEPYNAAAAEMTGLELDTSWVATKNLTFTAAISILDSEFTDFPDADVYIDNPAFPGPPPAGLTPRALVTRDLKGSTTLNAPEFTASLGATYSHAISVGTIDASALFYYNDGFNASVGGEIVQDSFHNLNLRAGLNSDSGWGISAYVNNATDEERITTATISSFGDLVTFAPPRTYGVEFSYDW